jgi:hypothetical protein
MYLLVHAALGSLFGLIFMDLFEGGTDEPLSLYMLMWVVLWPALLPVGLWRRLHSEGK